jgi:uncharacterized protein YndB with AHSA1/START domain
MTPAPGTEAAESAHDIVVTRVLDAPRELVWKVWNDPVAMEQWWGPKGFTGHSCTIDLRVGGRYRFCMRAPDGTDMWNAGVYTVVEPPARLVCTQSLSDAEGNVLPLPPHLGMPGDHTTITVTFEDLGGRTRLTLRHSGFPAGDPFGAGKAWGQALEKLAARCSPLAPFTSGSDT